MAATALPSTKAACPAKQRAARGFAFRALIARAVMQATTMNKLFPGQRPEYIEHVNCTTNKEGKFYQ